MGPATVGRWAGRWIGSSGCRSAVGRMEARLQRSEARLPRLIDETTTAPFDLAPRPAQALQASQDAGGYACGEKRRLSVEGSPRPADDAGGASRTRSSLARTWRGGATPG